MTSAYVREDSKVILSGENAVVFGATSVACSIAIANTCEIHKWKNEIFRISINDILAEFDRVECIEIYGLMQQLRKSSRFNEINTLIKERQLAWLRAVLGRLILQGKNIPYFEAKINLAMPLGSGIGGSATSTCLLLKGITQISKFHLQKRHLFEISHFGDKIAHGGNASGTDSATIVYGGFRSYHRDTGSRPIATNQHLRLILCYSGKTKESGTSLEMYRRFRESHPQEFDSIIERFNSASIECIKILEKTHDIQSLGKQLNSNQDLQREMGTSTKEIDKIVAESQSAGALGAKLTGGGCGGIVIILPDPERESEIASKLCNLGKIIMFVETSSRENIKLRQ